MTTNFLPIFQLKRLVNYTGSCVNKAQLHTTLQDVNGGRPQPHLVPYLSQGEIQEFPLSDGISKEPPNNGGSHLLTIFKNAQFTWSQIDILDQTKF